MTYEYQIWVIPVDKPKSKTFVVLQDGDWMSLEALLYIMLDPGAGDQKMGLTLKVVRRAKK